MDVKVLLQGVANAPSLLDLIESAAAHSVELTIGVAFASKGGAQLLFSRDSVARLAIEGSIRLTVGIDAVTDRAALESLQELEAVFAGLAVSVFVNPSRNLFHPKVFHFKLADGSVESICGSGNLTVGGLLRNYEALTVLRLEADEVDGTAFSWLSGLSELAEHCEPISERTFLLAERNARQPVVYPVEQAVAEAEDVDEVPLPDKTVLIGYVPKAGGRWSQLHLNRDVLPRFFEVPARAGEKMLLSYVDSSGRRHEAQERPVVFSSTNKNLKIELSAASGLPYVPVPIVVFRRTGPRRFDYMLLMPGQAGHAELSELLNGAADAIGRGHTRIIRPQSALFGAWPACPLPE